MTFAQIGQSMAASFIWRHGRSMTITRVVEGTYNAATGSRATTESTTELMGIIMDYRTHDIGELVQSGDRRITIQASDVTNAPEPGDKVTVGTDVWSVMAVKRRESAGISMTYEMQVRQ